MYSRQYDNRKPPVKIPENYSGHAFKPPSPYSDMPPPTHIDVPPSERREEMIEPPRNVDESRVPFVEVEPIPHEDRAGDYEEEQPKKESRAASSIFSSLLPSSILGSNHFPFGHGLGSEEILILAIMLLVYLSGAEKGKPDTEFLLMLGLLLFAG